MSFASEHSAAQILEDMEGSAGMDWTQLALLASLRWAADKSSVFIGPKLPQKYTFSFACEV